MSIFVELGLSNPRLVLAPTIESCPETTISVEFQPVTDTNYPKMIFSIRNPTAGVVEQALDRDPTVERWRAIDEFDGSQYYRVDLSAEAKNITPGFLERGVRFLSAETDGRGWRLTAVVRDREALQEFQTYLREKDVNYRLIRLHEAEQTAVGATLTDSQRETLIEAYRAGYFEVPRRGSLKDVADALGISQSAVSQRLRRAWARIVESELLDAQTA